MTNAELLAKVWPDVHVEGAALRVHISTLQKVLGSRPSGGRFIANVAGRGYRFIGPLADSGSTPVCLTSAPTSSNGELPRNGSIRVVGRELAVQTLVENLPARRFITITGPGGIGKTTVALAVAMQLASEYRDGVRFIDLTTLPNSGLVLPKVASELQLHGSSFQSESDLAAYLQGRQMLLVLDNCEHLVEAVALLAERVNAAAPCVHILTTSREPLRAVGEWVHRLPPLDLPPPTTFSNAAEVLSAPSVMLFIERAKAANDGFGLAQADLPSVVEICRRVDGIPSGDRTRGPHESTCLASKSLRGCLGRASASSQADAEPHCHGSALCERPSTGVIAFSLKTNGRCCAGSPPFAGASLLTLPGPSSEVEAIQGACWMVWRLSRGKSLILVVRQSE